jgi:hypothetical protein
MRAIKDDNAEIKREPPTIEDFSFVPFRYIKCVNARDMRGLEIILANDLTVSAAPCKAPDSVTPT